MANSIDKRIVEMQFDNSRFEQNMNQSISTLDKLKSALNLNDAAKGFNQLEKQANSIDLSGLERSISNIEYRFSALGIAGATVISTLTNKALGAVGKLNNAVFGQMKSGGISRALNLEHANFMMQGLLKDADKVAEIMKDGGPVQSAVKGTAYGLDAAANAAAQFIASGVKDADKLETALTAISGAAAMTGSSYEDISRIFTTVAGNGRLMADQLNQFSARGLNAAAALAEALGKTEGEIREMVSKGKIDFETFATVMNDTFGSQAKKANDTFTGALSNVKAALSRIGAKVAAPTIESLRKIFVNLITVIDNTSKTLQPMIDYINKVITAAANRLQYFLERTDKIDAIVKNIVDTIGAGILVILSVIKPLKKAFENVFPKKTVDDAIALTASFRDFVLSLRLSADTAQKVGRIFQGVFSVFDIIGQVISALIRVLLPATDGIKGFAGGFLEAIATAGDYITAIAKVLKESDAVYAFFMYLKKQAGSLKTAVSGPLQTVYEIFKKIIGGLKVKMPDGGSIFSNLSNSIKEAAPPIEKAGSILIYVFKGLFGVINEVSPLLGSFAGMVGKACGEIANGFNQVFNGGGFKTLLSLVSSGLLASLAVDIAYFISNIVGTFSRGVGLMSAIRGTIVQFTNTMKAFQVKIQSEAILNVAKAIGILVISLVALSLIDSEALTRSLIAVTVMMGELIGVVYLFTKISDSFKNNLSLVTGAMAFTSIATSILILAGAMKVIASIEADKLMNSFGVLTALLLEMTIIALTLSVTEAKIQKGAGSLILMAVAVKVLGSAMAQIGNLQPDQLVKGLIGVTVALVELAAAALVLSNSKFSVGTGAAMILMAASLKVIGSAIEQIGNLQAEQLSKGLVAIAAALAEIAVFMTLMGDASHVLGTAVAIGILALALQGIGAVITALGQLTIGELAKGLIGMAAALGAMGVALTLLSTNTLGMIGASVAIGLLAISLNALLPILSLFASMNLAQFAMALGGLALSLTILGGAAVIFGMAAVPMLIGAGVIAALGAACLVSAAGMAASALAIGLIVSALESLNEIKWLDLLSGLGKLVATFTLLGVSAIALAPAVVTMIGLSAALIGIGAAAVILAASISVAAIGLTLMAEALKKFDEISWASIEKGLVVLGGALVVLAGTAVLLAPLSPIIVSIGVGVAALGAGALMTAASLLLFGEAIKVLGPYVSELGTAIMEFASNARKYISEAVDDIWNVLVDLGANLSTFILNIGSALLNGIISLGAMILKALVALGGEMLKALGVPEDWVKVATDFMNGLITGIADGLKKVVNKVKEVGTSMIAGIRDAIHSHSDSKDTIEVGHDFDGGLITGVLGLKDKVVAAVGDVGEGMKEQAREDASDVQSIWDSVSKGTFTLSNAQQASAAAEDKKRSDMRGYNSIEELTRAGQAGQIHLNHKASTSTEAETKATGGNTKATKSNTKAKKENKEANDKKTKAIDEETEALGEEEEAAEDNSEAIREMAEQIEVVTEKYHEWQGTKGFKDTFGTVKSLSKALGKFWSTALGKDKLTSAYVNKVFKPLDKNLKMVSDTAKKGIYAFDENGKYLKKLGKVTKMSNKEIEAYVSKTGKTVTKVLESEAVTYRKFGNTVEKTTSRVTKSVKNMAKFAKEAKDFNNWMAGQNASSLILNAEGIDQITDTLRKIEKYNTTLGKMNQQTQDYLGGIRWKMGDDLAVSMNALGRAMDGYASGWNKNSQTLAYTEDAFLSLAAALYDGSEAANEYATEEARLMFLFENGEATWEEVEEHHVSYIQRIIDKLKEYRDSIEQNLRGSLDVFAEFNKNLMPEGTDLISNIESQIAGYTNWGNMLMELSKRGMNANLLKQLTDEGVQSYGKLAQLLKMSRGELALFNQRYKETEAAIAHARDMSLSAVANATTLASQRAAAASGKMTKAQLKASKKAAKEMINDAKAVADNQVRYKALTVKEEEHYLKNLTEEAKKAYHEQVKASKKLYKEEQKLAKKEEERRKKEARNDKIIGKIKNYKSLIKILRQYSKDAETTTMINKKFAEAFKEVDKSMVKMNGTSVKSLNRGLLHFAETLEETGNESNNYFQEMAERVQNYVKSVKEAIKSNIDLTKSYETAEKTSMMKTLLSARLTIVDEKKVAGLLSNLVKMGYNSDVIKMLTEYYTNNGAAAFVAFADGYVNASKEQVQKTNAMWDESKKLAEKNAKAVASANAASFMDSKYDSWKKQKEKLSKEKKELSKLRKSIYVDNTKEVASQNQQINELEKQKLALMNQLAGASKNQKKQIKADISSIDQQIAKTKKTINKLSAENGQTKLNKEIAEKDKQLSEVNRRIAAEEQRLASLGKRANDADKQNLQQLYRERNALQQTRQAMVKENSDNLKKEADLNTKIAKDETAVAKAKREMMEADAVQFRKLQLDEAKAATTAAKAVVDADKKEVDSAKKKAKAAKKARQKIEDELKKEKKKKKKDAKLIAALENELAVAKANEATANANLEVLQEALTESTKKYTDAKNKEKQATENLTKAEKDRAKANQETNEILHRNEATDNLEKLIKLSKELGQYSKVFKAVAEAMTKPLSYFEKKVTGVLKNGNISNLARNMARYNEAISDLDYGLIRFAEHLGAAATNALDFGEAVAEALSDYEGTLRSALQSSSDFFSKFNGYADEKNPLTAMDYVNYADSQIKALEEWQAAMLKLSDRGLAKEIVESFASEGLNSYEKVMAWVKASDHEIAEYNHLYKQHTELIASSTDAAFTSVIAGYSRAGEALQNALMNSFAKGSLERLTEIINDDVDKSMEMVINGVANGVNNAMPKIVEIVKKEDGTIVETVVSSTGEALSNSKVVSTLSNGVNNITTKATTTAGTTISSFADNVATNLMTKSTTTVDAMVNEAVNKFKMAVDTINSYVAGIRTDFTIRIHVDTTEIDAAINKFNNAVNSINASANTTSTAVKNSSASKSVSDSLGNSNYVSNGGTPVTYIQNNYSPKALDRSEIYRMTNNQLTGYTVAGVRY